MPRFHDYSSEGGQPPADSDLPSGRASFPFVDIRNSSKTTEASSGPHGDHPSQYPHDVMRQRDGKVCRTCYDFKTWMKMFGRKKEATADRPFEADQEQLERLERDVKQCPVDKDELGQATWKFLHTMSVSYPERPSQQEQNDMTEFLRLFAKVYPCEPCAEDFQKDMATHPPTVHSGEALATWLCHAHNRVNEKLDKKQFDCSRVFERWRDGWADGSCD